MNERYIQAAEIDWTPIDPRSYLRQIPALARTGRLELEKNVTFFVGENGTGKSTLLEAIAVAYGFNPEGGTMNYRFETYNDVSPLSSALRLIKGYRRPLSSYFFRAESFFNLATKAEEYDRYNPCGIPLGIRACTTSPTAKAFWPFSSPSTGMAFTSWTSRRRPCLPSAS